MLEHQEFTPMLHLLTDRAGGMEGGREGWKEGEGRDGRGRHLPGHEHQHQTGPAVLGYVISQDQPSFPRL